MTLPPDEPETGRPGLGRRLRMAATLLPRKKLSELLQGMVDEITTDRITLGDLLHRMEGRAFGALFLIFAFPNILPSPPGLAGVLGVPLIYLSTQLMLGRMPWLPGFIASRSITREAFASLVGRAIPWIQRGERMLRHRFGLMVSPPAERVVGAICLILSLLLILPIPFGNMLPSIAISIFGMGILERDGVWIMAGTLAALVATTVVGSLAYALVKSSVFLWVNAF